MNKIALLSFYFGEKLPALSRLIFRSWGLNPQIDFLVPTDCVEEFKRYGTEEISNIHLIETQQDQFLDQLEANLDMDFGNLRGVDPWELTKLKPALGECFTELLKDYKFWGYIDIDVLLGQLGNFVKDELLEDYDILPFNSHIRGNIIIIRNNDRLKTLWRDVPDYKALLNNKEHVYFDELFGRYFPDVVNHGRDFKVRKHTRDECWTVDFRWNLFEVSRKLLWRDNFEEILYEGNRLFDKFRSQELAAVVLDVLSKWSSCYGFTETSTHLRFFDPKINYYSTDRIEDIKDVSILCRRES